MKLRERHEIPEQDTWDLSSIFESDQAWEKAFEDVKNNYKKIENYKGKVTQDAKTLLEVLKLREEISFLLGHVYTYAHLSFDVDVSDSKYQGMQNRAIALLTDVGTSFSYIVPEILEVEESVIKDYLNELEELKVYEHYFNDIFKAREHTLSEAEEKLLASADDVLGTFSDVYGMFTNSEMKMPTIKDNEGNEITLSYSVYAKIRESNDRELRERAFMAMHNTYGDYANTLATVLSGQIKANNFVASARGFKSARHASLFKNNVDEEVYEQLITTVNNNLDALHEYVELRKDIMNLDEIKMFDVYVPLVEDIGLEFTFEDGKEIVLEALKPLGEEYISVVQQAFDDRWIDIYENKGKRSGAYSSGTYGTNPYILLNWQDTLDNVYTLAHELGHSLHSYYTRKYQPQVYGNYSIFVAEVASTTNEQLLTDYLLTKYKDNKAVTAYVINHYLDGVKGTVFRQTQFAEFEHLIHQHLQEGQPLTGEFLTQAYYDLNKKYYGDTMVHDKEIGYEWALIPHFYYDYYVYQYATGFSAATALSEGIINRDEQKIEDYINYLKAGSSQYPIDVLKTAGVDMSRSDAVEATLDIFRERLAILKDLLK